MERFQELRDTAKTKLKLADHMLTQTYPSLKDSKLLIVVLGSIFSFFANALASILHYEKTFKRIPSFSDNLEHSLEIFSQYCIPRYNLSQEYLNTIRALKELIDEHKRSPVEFSRKDSFVICSDSYRIKLVTAGDLKKHLGTAKRFLDETNKILSQEEDIFR